MNTPGFKKLRRTLVLVLPLLLGLSSCDWEVGKNPNPTPTPTPTPTPSPTPVLTNILSTQSLSVSPLSVRVAQAEAGYFEEVTSTAAEETTAAREALSRAVEDPAGASHQVRTAKASLAAAADAYRKSEAAIFFAVPESPGELRAQPDPLQVATGGMRDEALEELSVALDKMNETLSSPSGIPDATTLLLEAKDIAAKAEKLETGFRSLAEAWKGDAADNFRGKYFLPSPEGAVARVFQGLLAMTGDLLPGRLTTSAGDPEEISMRLRAVREIYLGENEGGEARPALHLLVGKASPVQAVLARASLIRATALAEVLGVFPDNDPVRSQLSAALEDLTRQLSLSAEALGIRVVDTGAAN